MGYDEKDMDRNHYLTAYGGNQPADIFRMIMAGAMGLSAEPPVRVQVVQPNEDEKEKNDPGSQVDVKEKEKQNTKKDDKQDELKEPEKKNQDNTERPKEDIKKQDTPKVAPAIPLKN
jgi:membrane peptidoglycan carboxypeptidase